MRTAEIFAVLAVVLVLAGGYALGARPGVVPACRIGGVPALFTDCVQQ